MSQHSTIGLYPSDDRKVESGEPLQPRLLPPERHEWSFLTWLNNNNLSRFEEDLRQEELTNKQELVYLSATHVYNYATEWWMTSAERLAWICAVNTLKSDAANDAAGCPQPPAYPSAEEFRATITENVKGYNMAVTAVMADKLNVRQKIEAYCDEMVQKANAGKQGLLEKLDSLVESRQKELAEQLSNATEAAKEHVFDCRQICFQTESDCVFPEVETLLAGLTMKCCYVDLQVNEPWYRMPVEQQASEADHPRTLRPSAPDRIDIRRGRGMRRSYNRGGRQSFGVGRGAWRSSYADIGPRGSYRAGGTSYGSGTRNITWDPSGSR